MKRVREELKLETIDPSLLDLLTQLLSKDLDKRPASVEEIMQHKFFSEPANENADKDSSSTLDEHFKSLILSYRQQA